MVTIVEAHAARNESSSTLFLTRHTFQIANTLEEVIAPDSVSSFSRVDRSNSRERVT